VSYVDSVLLPDERVVCSAMVHWIVFVPAGLFFFMLLLGLGAMAGDEDQAALGVFAWPGLLSFIWALFIRGTTELSVTSKRVIARFGFFRRETVDLRLGGVSGLHVTQGIFGRWFGYGTIRIHGTGGVQAALARVADPVEFRRQAEIAIDIAQSRESAPARAA
jgi:uncharacterized membrane protein YdbT with pleckstrin-like domain